MKWFFYVVWVLLFLSACSQQKRIQRASNKIYQLTERHPSLIELKDSTLFLKDTLFFPKKISQWVIDLDDLTEFQDTIQLTDSLQALQLFRKSSTQIGLQAVCQADTQIIQRSIDFSFPQIKANCNCKQDIKRATTQLRKTNRRLILLLILLSVGIGFFTAKRFSLW